jgi:cell division initiation protein
MDSSNNATSALDAIDTVAFKVGLKGYNVDEVDEFLERLSVEARQLKDQLLQMRQQLRLGAERINQLESGRAPSTASAPLPSAPAPAPAPAAPPRLVTSGSGPEQVTALIVLAQQFIEKTQQEAEEQARGLTVAAQERAREIIGEARSRAEDEVNRLNGLKQRLSEDVELLTRQLDTERTRLSAALAEFSRWVESSLQMGAPPRASHATPPATPRTTAPIPTQSAPSTPRPASPPPAQPSQQQTIGQVLNFDQPSSDDRL